MSWDEVLDQLDLPALAALTRYWHRHPPVHVMVAAYVGYKGDDEPKAESSEAAIEQLMAAFPQVQR